MEMPASCIVKQRQVVMTDLALDLPFALGLN